VTIYIYDPTLEQYYDDSVQNTLGVSMIMGNKTAKQTGIIIPCGKCTKGKVFPVRAMNAYSSAHS